MTHLAHDLIIYRRKQIIKRIIPLVLLEILAVVFLVLWGNALFYTDLSVTFQAFCYIVVLLIPFLITGVPFKLIDHTYTGTVDRVEVKTSLEAAPGFKRSKEDSFFQNTVYLHITTPDGQQLRKRAFGGKVREQKNWDMYKAGDCVFHLYGSPYIIILPNENSETVLCPVCGVSNECENNTCRKCGHTLVKKV